MPDWVAVTIGVVSGVGGGLALGYLMLVRYFGRNRT